MTAAPDLFGAREEARREFAAELAGLIEKRLDELVVRGECEACHSVELRTLLVRVKKIASGEAP